MNKKFSTLVAGMLLATTVGTAYAQGPAQLGTISAAPSAEYVGAIENGKFYQLTNGTQILIMDKTSAGTYVLKFVDYNKAELAKSLWDIQSVKNNGENGVAFQFVNLTTGLPISFDPESANKLGGQLVVSELSQGTNYWSWLRGTEGAALLQSKSVEAYFGAKNDSIITLVNTKNGIAAVKYATKDVPSISNHLKFTVKKANPVYLNAYDLNTMLQSRDAAKGLTLTFNDEPEGAEFANEFTARNYEAVAAVGKNSLSIGTKADKYAELQEAAKKMGEANTAYYAKLDELAAANDKYQGILQELAKLEASINSLNYQLGQAQLDEYLAKIDLENKEIALDILRQQVESLPADEALQEELNKAYQALGNAQGRLSAYMNDRQALVDARNDAKDKMEEAYSKWMNSGSMGVVDEYLRLYQAAREVYSNAVDALKKFESDNDDKYRVIMSDLNNAQIAISKVHEKIAGNNELKDQLAQAEQRYSDSKDALDKIQANLLKIDRELTKYQLERVDVLAKFEAAGDETYALLQQSWEAEAAKNAANQAYFNAVDAYVAVQTYGDNWYSLKSDGKYLMVDTAYMESYSSGIKHQKFAMKEHNADFAAINGNIWNARDINGRFNYRFYYYPTVDSLVISADGGNEKWETVTYWKDRKDYQIYTSVQGRNVVKLANLSNKHQEVTIGAPELVLGKWNYTLNTRIGLNLVSATPGKDIPAGVYFADIVKDKDNLDAISRLMLDLDGQFTKIATAEWSVMKFEDMPAAKWVVKENTIYNGSPAILNQESAGILNGGAYRILDVTEDGTVVLFMSWYNYQGGREDATIKLTPVSELNQLGYVSKGFSANTDSLFTFNYLNVAGNVSVQIGTENDTILRVAEGEGTKFILENATKDAEKYGVDNAFLKRAYYIRVNDANKLNNNYKYVTVSNVDGTELMVVTDKLAKADLSTFYLKEVNHTDSTHYYALIAGDKKAGIIDASGLVKAENIKGETRTSAFALNIDKTVYYRKFTADELGKDGVLNFYRANTAEKAYLYAEDNLLKVENKGDNAGDLADLNVIPAVTEGTIMPQYFIAKDVKVIEADTILCTEDHASVEEALKCEHTKFVKDTVYGDFLVNFKIDADLDKANLWENKYSRLGFLKGYITEGKLFVNNGKKIVEAAEVEENAHNAAKFSFRLVDDEEAQDFLIESESWAKDKAGKEQPFLGDVRPFENGGWIKIQNTVPVIVKTDYEDAVASADLFNVDTNAGSDPTANEDVTVSAVTVIAGEGQVTIAGAAGKKVVITNILGQTVANTVLSSDNAQIAAPQGVVVVAVEGEEAVKAIVK